MSLAAGSISSTGGFKWLLGLLSCTVWFVVEYGECGRTLQQQKPSLSPAALPPVVDGDLPLLANAFGLKHLPAPIPSRANFTKGRVQLEPPGSAFKNIAPVHPIADAIPALAQPPLSPFVSDCCRHDMVWKRGSEICQCAYPIKLDLLLLNVSLNPDWNVVFLDDLATQLELHTTQIEIIKFYLLSLSTLNISMDITPNKGISFSASEAAKINSSLSLHKVQLDSRYVGNYSVLNITWFKAPPPSQAPTESRGYLLVHTNGGLNQMRSGICDMVAVARIINATLVIPELDKRSFWQDTSNFSDVFDEEHFMNSLANDVKIIKKLPNDLVNETKVVKQFISWSGMDYYENEIASLWEEYQVIRASKSDSRLANNNLPPDIQKLRCRACYEALRFSPHIEQLGKLLVERMRSFGPYIALHLRYEKDMLAFSGCTHDLSLVEAEELRMIRENISYWKIKEIDPIEQRSKGLCPLTPKEVGIFLTALGYPSTTPIYIAAGEIYGGESHMAELRSRYPLLMSKEKLASIEELEPFSNHASQMAALDYIVSIESDVFIPSYSGNMAKAVEGHRRFLGRGRTISPDKKALVRLFDKLDQGLMTEGKKLSNRIIDLHRRRLGSPRKRKGPISGTKGMERFRSEETFYANPLPDCLCRTEPPPPPLNTSHIV